MTYGIWLPLFLLASRLVLIDCIISINEFGEELDDNLPVTCGIRPKLPSFRPQHGKLEAIPHSWPWHVGLYSSKFGASPYCGGTLIAPKWVLTAAHCISALYDCRAPWVGRLFNVTERTGHLLVIRVGDHDYTVPAPSSGSLIVQEVILHPRNLYLQSWLGFDVALLKLQRTVRRARRVQFACIPEAITSIPLGTFCYFAGWGRVVDYLSGGERRTTTKLMDAKVPIISNEECREEDMEMRDLLQICTEASFGAACTGDSGGGIHCVDRTGRWIVYGIISYGKPDCLGQYNVHGLTGRFREWIKEIVRNN